MLLHKIMKEGKREGGGSNDHHDYIIVIKSIIVHYSIGHAVLKHSVL